MDKATVYQILATQIKLVGRINSSLWFCAFVDNNRSISPDLTFKANSLLFVVLLFYSLFFSDVTFHLQPSLFSFFPSSLWKSRILLRVAMITSSQHTAAHASLTIMPYNRRSWTLQLAEDACCSPPECLCWRWFYVTCLLLSRLDVWSAFNLLVLRTVRGEKHMFTWIWQHGPCSNESWSKPLVFYKNFMHIFSKSIKSVKVLNPFTLVFISETLVSSVLKIQKIHDYQPCHDILSRRRLNK